MSKRRKSDSRDSREQESLDVENPGTPDSASTVETERFAQEAATTGAWDPYEVWLTRVKRPRDETARMRKLSTRVAEHAADAAAAGASSSSETPPQSSPKPSTA
jgi:hypothetical protein